MFLRNFPRPLGRGVRVYPIPCVFWGQHQWFAIMDIYHPLITGSRDDHKSGIENSRLDDLQAAMFDAGSAADVLARHRL